MKKKILVWFKNHPVVTKWLNICINILILVCFIIWIFKPFIEKKLQIEFLIDFEASFAFLSGTSILLNNILRGLLLEAEYSPSYALATGYIKNFISPVITQLIENRIPKPKIYIFKPKRFEDLSPDNIDRMKADLKNKDYSLKIIKLSTKSGRARDILIVNKINGEQLYYDFPNTLLSLFAYVDYKLDSKPNTKVEDKKEVIVKELIDKFYEKLDELLIEYNIQEYVFVTDNELNGF